MGKWEQEGKTVVLFGWDGTMRGLLAFGDQLRDEAGPLVSELRRHGVNSHLVSGDSVATTRWVASRIGTDSYRAEILVDGGFSLRYQRPTWVQVV